MRVLFQPPLWGLEEDNYSAVNYFIDLRHPPIVTGMYDILSSLNLKARIYQLLNVFFGAAHQKVEETYYNNKTKIITVVLFLTPEGQ